MRGLRNDLIEMGLANPRAKRRLLLSPTLIEEALARLSAPLSLEEQKMVMRVVADPSQVAWPGWWEV